MSARPPREPRPILAAMLARTGHFVGQFPAPRQRTGRPWSTTLLLKGQSGMSNASVARRLASRGVRAGKSAFRVAIVSTPRSGNTWLWHLLTALYDVPGLAVHSPLEVAWDALPESCVLQIHWPRVESFASRLREHGFRIVVMARHPLDVLISILHFCIHDRATARWLEGEGGNERPIFGAMPRSSAFRAYATGARAAALLRVTNEWWEIPGSLGVRYEDLNRDPCGELRRLARALGGWPRKSVEEVVEATTIPKLRLRWQNSHYFWLGKTGLWRALLPAADADLLLQTIAPRLARLGYSFDPDPGLSDEQADANWVNLVWAELVDDLHDLSQTQKALRAAQGELVESRAQAESLHKSVRQVEAESAISRAKFQEAEASLQSARADLGFAHETLDQTLKSLHQTSSELEATRAEMHLLRDAHEGLQRSRQWALEELAAARLRLIPLEDLGPLTLRMARGMRRLSTRYPMLSDTVKRVFPRPGQGPKSSQGRVFRGLRRRLRRVGVSMRKALHSILVCWFV